jgi:hypothetical protein
MYPAVSNLLMFSSRPNGHFNQCVCDRPIAPASSNASACTNPNPRPAPVTRTTLPSRLNSGRRFAVPRYGGVDLRRCSAASSASGAAGGVCKGEAARKGRERERLRDRIGVRQDRAVRKAARGRQRRGAAMMQGEGLNVRTRRTGGGEREGSLGGGGIQQHQQKNKR